MNPPRILLVDKAGQPIEWANWRAVTALYAKSNVLWTLGNVVHNVFGGINRASNKRSVISLHSIVATNGVCRKRHWGKVPLTNKALFQRDGNLCMYCGEAFSERELTRDHIVPTSRGGKNVWANVAAACKRCNHGKGNKLLSECDRSLLALPYEPNHAEYLALISTGRIRADQMAFLRTQFSGNYRA